MSHIVTVQDAVTAFADWIEPTNAELDAIEQEMPAILADVDRLDTQIITLERMPSALEAGRIRRTQRRMLAERTTLANRAATSLLSGDAA
jgi:septal ring factor EnvC (AmiA/AmiB activator)